jgi:hypothetical protein
MTLEELGRSRAHPAAAVADGSFDV